MVNKTKTETIKANIAEFSKSAGLIGMVGAMALMTAEVAGIHPPKAHETHANDKRRAIVPGEAHVPAPTSGFDANKENARRAEEVGPHHVSYGAMQRTPARSGAV